MRRRRFIAGSVSLTAMLSGCVWAESSDWESPTGQSNAETRAEPVKVELQPARGSPTRTPTDTSTETTSLTRTSTPLSQEAFVSSYEQSLQAGGYQGDWELSMTESSVTITYAAGQQTHERLFRVFLSAFLDLVRTKDEPRNAQFVVNAEGHRWYTWTLSNERVREHLGGSLEKSALISTAWEERTVVSTPTPTPTQTPSPTPTTTQTQTPTPTATQTPGTDEPITLTVAIQFDHTWSGRLAAGSYSEEINGDGETTINVDMKQPQKLTVTVWATAHPRKTLTVSIVHQEEVVAEDSTDRGTISIEYTPPQAE
ncbi:hypothetical protein [Halocatena halophila]|uniref:hypothetical protein n=1 Tax=Halocatena halophila TaxID=2814576 RepID=UPI002ED60FE7